MRLSTVNEAPRPNGDSVRIIFILHRDSSFAIGLLMICAPLFAYHVGSDYYTQLFCR